MLYHLIKKGFPVFCIVFTLSINSCNGIFEQEESITIIFQLENSSPNDITLVRYKISNTQDTVSLASDELFSETEAGKGPGGSGENYAARFDSIQIIYNDSVTITHARYNQSQALNHLIFYSDTWDIIKQDKIKNWLTEITKKYRFTNQDFEEAQLKGKIIL